MMNKQQMLDSLQKIIREAAQQELLPRFRQITRQFKADGSIVTEADLAMQQRVMDELKAHWPEIALLGEEMSTAEQQHQLDNSPSGLWILDPLDGTSNFAAGIPCFSVSLALFINGKVELGLIYDPLLDECFIAIDGKGTYLNGERLQPSKKPLPLEKCIAQVDFKRLPNALAAQLATQPPYSSQRSFGSGTLDWCWLAAGRVHLYVHGQQKLWDYSAGQLILREAGGHSCTFDGDAVFQGKLQARSVVAALDAEHFVQWKKIIIAD